MSHFFQTFSGFWGQQTLLCSYELFLPLAATNENRQKISKIWYLTAENCSQSYADNLTFTSNFFSTASPAIRLLATNLMLIYPSTRGRIKNVVDFPDPAFTVNFLLRYSSNPTKMMKLSSYIINFSNYKSLTLTDSAELHDQRRAKETFLGMENWGKYAAKCIITRIVTDTLKD